MLEHRPFRQAMLKAVSQTLENMAFLEAMEHYNQEIDIPAEQVVWTSLLIHDPVQGEIRLALPQKLLRNMTAGMFAIDGEEVTPEQMTDIINELLNTIAGLFMTNLLTADQTFQLGLPEFGEGPLPEAEAGSIIWKLMTPEEDPLQIYASGASLVALCEA